MNKKPLTDWDKAAIALLIVPGVFAVLFALAVIGHNAATRLDGEAAPLQNLRTIAAFEIQYFNTHQRTFGTFEQLRESGLSPKLRGKPAVTDGYVFTITLAHKPNGTSGYTITADPQDKSSGTNHFYVDSDGQGIHVNPDHQAGPADPEM